MRKRKQIKLVRSLLCLLMCFVLMGGSIPVKAAETVEATVSIPLLLQEYFHPLKQNTLTNIINF